jgi:hypothetical protein
MSFLLGFNSGQFFLCLMLASSVLRDFLYTGACFPLAERFFIYTPTSKINGKQEANFFM